ncbi:HAD family hydrolase [Paenibacillus thalictri]|nr:HAD family hydrolase [Paenibacillus thalictri]
MPSWKLVLFDLDDTLVRFDDYWPDSIKETFRQHEATRGFDAEQLFDVFMVKNSALVDQYHKQEISLQRFRNERLIAALAEYGVQADEDAAISFNRLHRQISKSFMRADPELVSLLQELSVSYRFGIVTNGTTNWQHDKIQAAGIGCFFTRENVVTSEDVGCEKPDPETYSTALRHYRMKPEEAVFIGDSWKNDVLGPAQLRMQAIWVNLRKEQVPDGSPQTHIGTVENILDIRRFLL